MFGTVTLTNVYHQLFKKLMSDDIYT